MTRSTMIQHIFDHVPRTYKGFNHRGEHVVQLANPSTQLFATLEKLSDHDLSSLADAFAINCDTIEEVDIVEVV